MLLRKPMVARLVAVVVLFLAVLALAGCNDVPISTQWKLRGFDLGVADMSQLRVAARAPSWASPTPEKTFIAARIDIGDGGAGRALDIHLRRAAHPEDRAALARLAPASESLVVYEVAPGDLPAVRALQLEAQQAKAAGRRGRIDVRGDLACRSEPIPEGPILVDVFIHASDEIGWLPLLERYDLRANAGEGDLDARTPLCGKLAGRAGR
ncbi:hypothetical protein [Methylocystis echinoides]|uniref:Lipoprotein n=1 Tax=Methylocystis echinoides TaxID=29468 RepID=A0A9W6LT63_9HYPH|nr:hypothetical protein [Methylocystis echinoides]GLI94176.1 hypothetical protein LMG27198_31680 [Methylocystis echinoides]